MSFIFCTFAAKFVCIMKKIAILAVTAMMVAGCGFLKNSTGSNQQTAASDEQAVVSGEQTTAAMSAGQGAGTAMQALYKQYKADGNKFDYTNLQNIINTMMLINNCEGLKENYKNTTYLSDFGKGMIVSSLGLITQDNVGTVTGTLAEMMQQYDNTVKTTANQAAVTVQNAAKYTQTTSKYASALGTLLASLGGK